MPNVEPPMERRAQPARPPAPTPSMERVRAAEHLYQQDREREQRRSLLRGLLWLVLAVLVFSITRAGLHEVFVHGWWRP
jgi:fatty acid desaturase